MKKVKTTIKAVAMMSFLGLASAAFVMPAHAFSGYGYPGMGPSLHSSLYGSHSGYGGRYMGGYGRRGHGMNARGRYRGRTYGVGPYRRFPSANYCGPHAIPC